MVHLKSKHFSGMFSKFWRLYDFQIVLKDALIYFHSSAVPLYTTSNDTLILRRPKAYSLIQFIELQKNFILRIIEDIESFFRIFQFFWPTLIGISDKVGDIYYATQCFADEYLRNMFLFFLVFPAVLQAIVWNIYLTKNRYSKIETDVRLSYETGALAGDQPQQAQTMSTR